MQQSIENAVHRIKFRHLLCFLEVARLGSVVKAADVLGVTQPAVSKTLHELEETLSVHLFDRSHRNVSLTRFGEVFLEYAGASVMALRQGVDSITHAPTAFDATVVVGSLPLASWHILPDAVNLFTQEALTSKIKIVTGPHAFLISELRHGDVDFVLGRMAEPDIMKGLSFEHLFSEELALVVRQGHPLLLSEPFDLAAITQYPTLMPPHGSAIRPIVDRFLTTHGIGAIRDQVETVSISFGRNYTRTSDAIWIISQSAIVDDIAAGQLTFLPADMSQTLGPIGLTQRAGDHLSLPAELLIRCIRQVSGMKSNL